MDLRGWGVRVVVVGVVVGVLAGCSGDADVVVTPTPTVTAPVVESPSPIATPTPSPSPTALTEEEVLAAIPEAARREDFWGAQEFTRFFLENYQEMMRDDPALFEAFSSEGCNFCDRTTEYYEDLEKNGLTVEGGHVTVTDEVARGALQEDGTWGVIFRVDAEPLIERNSANEIVTETAGGPGEAKVLLEYAGHWSVLEIGAEVD